MQRLSEQKKKKASLALTHVAGFGPLLSLLLFLRTRPPLFPFLSSSSNFLLFYFCLWVYLSSLYLTFWFYFVTLYGLCPSTFTPSFSIFNKCQLLATILNTNIAFSSCKNCQFAMTILSWKVLVVDVNWSLTLTSDRCKFANFPLWWIVVRICF